MMEKSLGAVVAMPEDTHDYSQRPEGGVVDINAAALEGSEEGNIVSHIRDRRKAWTAEELSELLSMSVQHIYKLARNGRMPSYRIGGAVRFDPAATADWLDQKAIAA